MCEMSEGDSGNGRGMKTIPVSKAVGTVLAHDITEIRPGEFKGRAFRKGHIVREEDICHLQLLGKEKLFILEMKEDELHEDEVARLIAAALKGNNVRIDGEPREGKVNLVADIDGLLKVNKEALLQLNTGDDIMCATLHDNTIVKKGQVIAGTRAIPLVVKKSVLDTALRIASDTGGIITVREMRKPRAGIVITGNEVFYGRIKDAFAPIITRKIKEIGGDVLDIRYAPDDEGFIEGHLRELLNAGADLLITTGGMSVDPDDVTRFAIKRLGASDIIYGSAVLPGAMFLVAYITPDHYPFKHRLQKPVPIMGIPACGMYSTITVFDLMLPRILSGEQIGRKELAELGHGGLCLKCDECRYPVCPFGKQ